MWAHTGLELAIGVAVDVVVWTHGKVGSLFFPIYGALSGSPLNNKKKSEFNSIISSLGLKYSLITNGTNWSIY